MIAHELSDEKGGHSYVRVGGHYECKLGCGAWMTTYRSDAPKGIDPFGKCPNNPMNIDPERLITKYTEAIKSGALTDEHVLCLKKELLRRLKS